MLGFVSASVGNPRGAAVGKNFRKATAKLVIIFHITKHLKFKV